MKKIWIFIVISFVTGFIGGSLSGNKLLSGLLPGGHTSASKAFEFHQGGFPFINPLLECEVEGETVEFKELVSFKKDIEGLVGSLKSKKWIDFSAIYFRDLNNGPWIGISEKKKFSPASLLKVPLMIAYFKEAETNPTILKKTIMFEKPDKSSFQNIKPSSVMQAGKKYSVEELIRRSIIYSDNDAYLLLLRNLDQKRLISIYTDLGVPLPIDGTNEDMMTVKEYATFFRVLFNASYLSREMSTKALDLLSKTEFRDGIVAGVPSSIGVVHKFGERDLNDKNTPKQMHDCAIVYYPEHPYLLCIMTRGDSFEYLDDSIKEISALIFRSVDSQFGKK